MSRVLIVEPHADGLLDLALRAQQYGHQVRYYLKDFDPIKQPVGRGLVERVTDWRASVRWADLIIVGSLGYCMQEFDRIQAEGRPIIGAGGQAAQWELDRMAGMQAFRAAGIPVPPYRHVSSLAEAAAYVKDRDEGMAVKPSGDVTDKSLSFVAKTSKEMLWRLDRWKREGKSFPQGLILQDRIEGVEMAVGAWIGPGGFAEGWEENFEEKRLFAGGIGPNCGEAGTVLRLVKSSKLANKVLKSLEDKLVSLGYVGNIDVNCIIDMVDGSPWPLEFTVRFGYPAINIELALHRGDPIEFLAGVASGKPPKTRAMDEVAVGVVMALWPYPAGHEKTEEVVGVPITGIKASIEDSIHPVMVQIDRNDQLCSAGSYLLVTTGTGKTVRDARQEAYRIIHRLDTYGDQHWRPDIGQRLRGQIPKVQEHGYAQGLSYA